MKDNFGIGGGKQLSCGEAFLGKRQMPLKTNALGDEVAGWLVPSALIMARIGPAQHAPVYKPVLFLCYTRTEELVDAQWHFCLPFLQKADSSCLVANHKRWKLKWKGRAYG